MNLRTLPPSEACPLVRTLLGVALVQEANESEGPMRSPRPAYALTSAQRLEWHRLIVAEGLDINAALMRVRGLS